MIVIVMIMLIVIMIIMIVKFDHLNQSTICQNNNVDHTELVTTQTQLDSNQNSFWNQPKLKPNQTQFPSKLPECFGQT